jgi:hypothetical protein
VTQASEAQSYFLLEVFDRELWCPVFQTRFVIPDLDLVRTLLGAACDDDQDLRRRYFLDEKEIVAIASAFGVGFDVSGLDGAEQDFLFYRWHSILAAPYLVHTGYELPLLLDGRKKLAKMGDFYPPMEFYGEHRFDHWVAVGLLHKEEVLEPFPGGKKPRGFLGLRTVYYTPKGEEWRIPAMKLIWESAQKSGGWNQHHQRLEGMLFGYEDWQNDWWINYSRVDPDSRNGLY